MNATMKQLVAALLAALLAGTATAQVGAARQAATPGTERNQEEMRDATTHINKAIEVIGQMQATPDMRAQLQRARGVFVVPDYGQAALVSAHAAAPGCCW